VQRWLELRTRNDERLALGSGSTTSPWGDAPVPFSPSMVVDKVEEACPELSWARDVVNWRGDRRFRDLGFEQQGFQAGIARGPIYREKELKISRVSRILSLDELVAD
jgi:hypothetical protein